MVLLRCALGLAAAGSLKFCSRGLRGLFALRAAPLTPIQGVHRARHELGTASSTQALSLMMTGRVAESHIRRFYSHRVTVLLLWPLNEQPAVSMCPRSTRRRSARRQTPWLFEIHSAAGRAHEHLGLRFQVRREVGLRDLEWGRRNPRRQPRFLIAVAFKARETGQTRSWRRRSGSVRRSRPPAA